MKKNIIIDTNYLNVILKDISYYSNILDNYKNEYTFVINIATFVEIVSQKINNKDELFKLIDLLTNYKFEVSEFIRNKCINYRNFSYNKLKIESKTDRRDYFLPIKNEYYNFSCKFISLFLEWILYALMQILSESLEYNKQYVEYLNKKSIIFHKEFKKLYNSTRSKIKVKDKFNSIILSELKIMKHKVSDINEILVNEIIKIFSHNEKEIMKIFHAEGKETKEIRQKFLDHFFTINIKPFLEKNFKNTFFEEYTKYLFEKLILRCGKMDGNDISDALIVASIGENDVLLTKDNRILKFLKSNKLYKKEIYDIFIWKELS